MYIWHYLCSGFDKKKEYMSSVFSPYVCIEQIADALCCSERTASRRVQPLKKLLGLRPKQSLTKQQVIDYFGSELKRKL